MRNRAGRSLLLLPLVWLVACTTPEPPAPGTPGINLATPPPTFLPATATPQPSTAALTTTPALPPTVAPTAPLGAAQPTPNRALPALVITPTQGSAVRIYVEIADTPERQETGLMRRTTMAEDQGMIFVFPGQTTIAFWMKDTLLPLSIAFIDDQRRIVDIQDMQPLDESLHNSAQPYTYALEMNQGYFRRHSIMVGDPVGLPPFPPTPTPAPPSLPPTLPPAPTP